MNKEEKEKSWSEKILEFRNRGKSKEAWCEKNKISLKQFGYWFRRFGKTPITHWIPVEIGDEITALPVSTINIKVGSAIIELNTGFDKELLLEILRTLQLL